MLRNSTSCETASVVGMYGERVMKAITGISLAAALLWGAAAGATSGISVQSRAGTALWAGAAASVQLAAAVQSANLTGAERRTFEESDNDNASEDLPPAPHKKLMPGQKPGTHVTGAPVRYDEKHLDRLWGRFAGVKETKEHKPHVPKGGGESRPTRWAR